MGCYGSGNLERIEDGEVPLVMGLENFGHQRLLHVDDIRGSLS